MVAAMSAIAVREARPMITRALGVFKGCHRRFFAYPDPSGRRCVVCVERPDGTDVFQVLAELDGPIPDIDDEHAIERQFFAAPDAGAVH
jgi:hypothetical protein